MDNYSDINLKGGSKIKVGDSLTISDSGVLGADNKPKYLEVEYVGGNAVIDESKVCIGADFTVIGNTEFSSCVLFKSFPKVDSSVTPPEVDNVLVTKKYVDSKVSSGGSDKAVEYVTKNSIGSNTYHYDLGDSSFEAAVIAAAGFCVRQNSNDVNAYILGKNDNGFYFNNAGGNFINLEFTDKAFEKIALESYVDAAIANVNGSASVPSELDVTSVKIANASNKSKFTELEYVNGNFALTNECGTKYNLPWENSSATRTLVTDFSLCNTISNGITTDYVCTDDIRFQNSCGDNFGQIIASGCGIEITGGAKLSLNGGGGNVNICASCGNVVMNYNNGGSIVTPSNTHGSTITKPNVFVTSAYGDSGCGLHMVVLTQAEYNQMSSHDMTTLYFISGC